METTCLSALLGFNGETALFVRILSEPLSVVFVGLKDHAH